MASISPTTDLAASSAAQAESLLVSLPSLPPDALQKTLATLAQAFPGRRIPVATPDGSQPLPPGSPLRLFCYTPVAAPPSAWVHTAADFINTFELAQKNDARCILMLGGETQSLSIAALKALASAIQPSGNAPVADLAISCYELGPREGLINSAILYPVTRALFGVRPRFPLAIDLGLSLRMSERLASVAQKFTAANQPEALLWPVSEASLAGFSIDEVEAGPRIFPQPSTTDLNTLLAEIAGSLFADIEAKAAFWQRARPIQTARRIVIRADASEGPADVKPMLDTFRLAYTNLHEIWSLFLPPASLLGLKRLSQMPAAAFRMPDALWVRIVFDFVLAYRLRTINRGHLLGALTPLYLAWVASHLLLAESGTAPDKHIETLAAAFEADKPYLVSRWRWPDRFNP
jgi:hypothetical protein